MGLGKPSSGGRTNKTEYQEAPLNQALPDVSCGHLPWHGTCLLPDGLSIMTPLSMQEEELGVDRHANWREPQCYLPKVMLFVALHSDYIYISTAVFLRKLVFRWLNCTREFGCSFCNAGGMTSNKKIFRTSQRRQIQSRYHDIYFIPSEFPWQKWATALCCQKNTELDS